VGPAEGKGHVCCARAGMGPGRVIHPACWVRILVISSSGLIIVGFILPVPGAGFVFGIQFPTHLLRPHPTLALLFTLQSSLAFNPVEGGPEGCPSNTGDPGATLLAEFAGTIRANRKTRRSASELRDVYRSGQRPRWYSVFLQRLFTLFRQLQLLACPNVPQPSIP
jgi:hypothetical protein